MNLSQRQHELAEEHLAEALGRPVRRCPKCERVAAHWVPETLNGHGILVAGYFTCEDTTPPVEAPLFDLGDTPHTDGPRSSGWYGGNK